MRRIIPRLSLLCALLLWSACSSDAPSTPEPTPDDPGAPSPDTSPEAGEETGEEETTETEGDPIEDTGADVEARITPDDLTWPEGDEPPFTPYLHLNALDMAPVRGHVTRRGTIHLHTGYSHDACDGRVWLKNTDPSVADGDDNISIIPGTTHLRVNDLFHACNDDVRASVCSVQQDFLFVTDHNGNFPSFEYPEVLLYRPSEGDELIVHEENPTANRMTCPDGREVMLAAGVDTHLLAFGLEHHVREDMDERRSVYGSKTVEAVEELREAGALVVSGYSDEWDADLLFSLPFDGFEIYNPATNLRRNMGAVLSMVSRILFEPERLPVAQLLLMPVFEENEENLWRWAVLSQLRPIFNYLGTNAHQNVFNRDAGDGERLDSFRRMMAWFSNYVLLPEGKSFYHDRDLKAAIGAGQHYGVFDYLGAAIGFDYHATVGGETYEMGTQLDLDPEVTLHVAIPRVYGTLPNEVEAPVLSGRILRADDREWVEVATGSEDFSFTVTEPGVYRAEIRMVPRHLRPWMGNEGDQWMHDYIWIYANPIFVGMEFVDDLPGVTPEAPEGRE